MLLRALAVWFGIMFLAIANGAVREKLIVPLTGDTAGHAISTLILCLLTFLASFVSINWIGPESGSDAMKVACSGF